MSSLSYALFLALLDTSFRSALNAGKLEYGLLFFCECEVIILNSDCMKDFKKSLRYLFIERKREVGREKRGRKRDTSFGCLLKVRAWEESATQVCAFGRESKP